MGPTLVCDRLARAYGVFRKPRMSILQRLAARPALAIVVPLAVGGTLRAAEYAVFQSGFRLRVERHEISDGRARLFIAGRGVMELPASSVVEFERDDYIEPRTNRAPDPPLETRVQINALAARLGEELDLHPALIHSVIEVESNFDADAVSPKGAVGLMQLMPETARELAVTDRFDPGQNVRGGASYLKQLLDRYAGSRDSLLRALAAYNAGPGAVDRYEGLPPYDETRLFVRRVIRRFLDLTLPVEEP